MKILFTTTVDQTFSKTNLIKAWLAWFFYSTIGTYNNDTSLELYISIGCMSLTDGKPLSRGGFQVLNGVQLKCTYLHNLLSPPYRAEHSKHLKLFSISHPDVRKMMLIYGFASTRKYDMIVYSDLDAFHIKNPLPELLTLKNTNNNYYAAAFSRHEYNISEVCQGFFAIFDMQLPQYWLSQGIFAQNEINDWLNDSLNIIGNPTFHQELRLPIRVTVKKHIFIKLLAEPDYFRGACKDKVTENMKIFHCHSMYNHLRKKEEDLSDASRVSTLDNSLMKKLLQEAVSMQTETETVSLRYGRRFRFRGKREKVLPAANYTITLNAQRLNLNPQLHQLLNGDKKWQELYKKFYPSDY